MLLGMGELRGVAVAGRVVTDHDIRVIEIVALKLIRFGN